MVNTHANDGSQQSPRTVQGCKDACRPRTDCLRLDFDTRSNTCYFFNAQGVTESLSGVNHYRKRPECIGTGEHTKQGRSPMVTYVESAHGSGCVDKLYHLCAVNSSLELNIGEEARMRVTLHRLSFNFLISCIQVSFLYLSILLDLCL